MRLLFVLAVALPGFALAAGGESSGAPKPTNTTKTCKGVKVWEKAKGRCVNPRNSSLSPDALIGAVRELAYAGRFLDAQGVLKAMPDQRDDLVLTYWGFTHRKLGHPKLANTFYARAISQNPDNHLARSYMGQGLVESGQMAQALAQWKEIRKRGGTDTWAEVSLRTALESGQTYSY